MFEDHVGAADEVDRGHDRNELFRDARETSETAEEDEPGDDGRDDARHRKRRPEGRVHGLRDRVRLHGVPDAAERDDDGDREEDGEGFEFLAEPLRDVVGRTAHDVAVGVMPFVGLRENGFGKDRGHPEEGRNPEPEERPRTARNERRGGTRDVARAHLSGDGRGERLKRTHPRLVGAFAEEGRAAEEVARGEPELADLNEPKLEGVENPRPAQERNEEEYAPKDAVDFCYEMVEIFHGEGNPETLEERLSTELFLSIIVAPTQRTFWMERISQKRSE